MAIRKVIFNVTKNGVTPLDYAWGGIQNEDNATEINFVIDNDYLLQLNENCEELFFRIDFESGYAGYHPSENLQISENILKRSIPKKITCYGGEITCTLTVTRLVNENESEQILTVPVTLFFTLNNVKDKELINNLSAYEEHILQNVKQCAEYKKQMEDILKSNVDEIAEIVKQEFIDVSEVAQ